MAAGRKRFLVRARCVKRGTERRDQLLDLVEAPHRVVRFGYYWRYGQGYPSQHRALEIMLRVYLEYPVDGFAPC